MYKHVNTRKSLRPWRSFVCDYFLLDLSASNSVGSLAHGGKVNIYIIEFTVYVKVMYIGCLNK